VEGRATGGAYKYNRHGAPSYTAGDRTPSVVEVAYSDFKRPTVAAHQLH